MDLIMNSIRTVAYAIIEPLHFLVLLTLGIIFYLKNKKTTVMQKLILGESINSPLELTLSQLCLGILGGVIVSVITAILGLTFNENSGIEIIFLISIALMLYKPRFICFSYSGSLLGIISIVSGIIATKMGKDPYINVNIVSLMAFIGVLHIVEGMLVAVDGSRGAIPVFTTKKEGIIGGFAFNRYWAMPIVIFIVMSAGTYSGVTQEISTPDWWPIVNRAETLSLLATAIISAMPLYGVIGYNSVTFTKEKEVKPRISGMFISIYGLLLLIVSQVAVYGIIGEICVVLFAPIAHEAMIRISRYFEERGENLYISDEDSVCILEVTPNSPAEKAGIQRGDRIVSVNNQEKLSEKEIFKIIRESVFNIEFVIRNEDGELKEYSIRPVEKRIGLLLVPKMVEQKDIIGIQSDDFKKVLDQLKNNDNN